MTDKEPERTYIMSLKPASCADFLVWTDPVEFSCANLPVVFAEGSGSGIHRIT